MLTTMHGQNHINVIAFYYETFLTAVTNQSVRHHHNHHHHQSFMELGHLLTRSGLTHPEVSLKRSTMISSASWEILFHNPC